MKCILTIIKKEFSRFFKDRRMVITLLLPGVLVYLLYSVMGTAFENIETVGEDYIPSAYVINMPSNEVISISLTSVLNISEELMTEEEAIKAVKDETLNVLVVFPENFDETFGGATAPDISVYYNSNSDYSYYGYVLVCAVLEQFTFPALTVNEGGQDFDLASDEDFVVHMLSMLIPLIMYMLLASACIAVAPESIAGEKERGTMATMLIAPVKRWQIALGKIISLSCFAMLSGLSSFLGVILSMPKLMGGIIGAETAALYSVGNYFTIFAVIISVVLVIISAFSVLSALAKNVKEASMMITPLMIVIMLSGIITMFFGSAPPTGIYAVPLLGSAFALSGIMSFTVGGLAVALAIISNLALAVVLTVLLGFMFKSEKIMFKK